MSKKSKKKQSHKNKQTKHRPNSKATISATQKKSAKNIWDNRKVVVQHKKKPPRSKEEKLNVIVGLLLMLYAISPIGQSIFIFNVRHNIIVYYLALTLPILHLLSGFSLLCRSKIGHRLLLGCSIWNMLSTYIPCNALVQLLYTEGLFIHHDVAIQLIGICTLILLQCCLMFAVTYRLYSKTLKPLYPSLPRNRLYGRPQKDIFDKAIEYFGKRI